MLQWSCENTKPNRSLLLKDRSNMNSEYNINMNVSRETRREALPKAGEPQGSGIRGTVPKSAALRHGDQISLTPSRRRILEILAREGRPLGEEQKIDRLSLLASRAIEVKSSGL
jgi:hypothetical protein